VEPLARPALKETEMNLVQRVQRILLSPRTEWEVIDAEPATLAGLYTGYIMPLAAIGPLAQLIGYSVFGITVPFMGTYRVPIGSAITTALVSYILTLGATYVLALIIDALAPTFNGQRNQIQALKVAAYSSTASWIAGIFALIPGLRLLSILGLYSLYLLYLGLPVLMKSPRERAVAYTALVVVAAIILFMIVGVIAGRFMAVPTAGMTVP
jgi:Yip1-like protein